MGAPLVIYRLYQLSGCEESYLLVKAERPEFPNWDQTQENAARHHVESKFNALVSYRQATLGFKGHRLIGTWEDGYPEGETFYTGASDLPLDVWIAIAHAEHCFVFGVANTEDEFWNILHSLHIDGDLWGFKEFRRPAVLQRVWFIQ